MSFSTEFSSSLLARLRRIRIRSARLGAATHKGERRSKTHGSSLEFADFREYLPGDDLRFIDWTAYARLDRLYVRLYHDEAGLRVRFVVDDSRSMSFGEPAKFDFGRRLAAGLAYAALAGMDEASIDPLSASRLGRARRGTGSFRNCLADISAASPESRSGITECLRRLGRTAGRNSKMIIFSDFLDPEGYEDGILFLKHRGYQIGLVQILAPDEINPAFAGDFLLEDAESAYQLDVTASPRLFARYRDELRAFLGGLDRFARRHRFDLARVIAQGDPDRLFFSKLREGGIVAGRTNG